MRFIFLLFIWMATSQVLYAQRCVTQELYERVYGINSIHKTEQFEQWLKKKREQKKINTLRVEAETLQIPIVVHVLHKGEDIGVGSNISDAQILSQITVLNEDFRRLNPDRDSTPEEFLPVAADLEVEFILAKQDPEGFETDGIVRVHGSKDEWEWTDQVNMKAESYWPAEDYLNLWVADITIPNGNVFGYSTFPESSLPGLNEDGGNRLTDGVAIDYTAFGSDILYPEGEYHPGYNRGRTSTHEIGHFLGLRHIWGDASDCTSTDFCNDTPDQLSSTSGCKSTNTSCNSRDMVQNYMDYTLDACMNLFTLDQKDRIRIVLANSPRRQSLTVSHALIDPAVYENDLGISRIISPMSRQCETEVSPTLEVRNYGSNNITEAVINMYIDGVLIETLEINLNIEPLEYGEVIFSKNAVLPGSTSSLRFEITEVNGMENANFANNDRVFPLKVPYSTNLPILEELTEIPPEWEIYNSDNGYTWERASAPSKDPQNKALRMNYYNYEIVGEIDGFISPVFDIITNASAFLSFDYSHAPYNSTRKDALLLGIIQNCQLDLQTMDTLFYAAGLDLATTQTETNFFIPSGENDWKTINFIDLSPYMGMENLQLVFMGTNGYGNNLYIDNINVSTKGGDDLGLDEFVSPSLLSCNSSPTPQIIISNNGYNEITSFNFQYRFNTGELQTHSIADVNIAPGDKYSIFLEELNALKGSNTLFMNISDPNGNIDANTEDNSTLHTFIVSDEEVPMPYRWTFDEESEEVDWINISSNNGLNWEKQTNGYARYSTFNDDNHGEKSWYFSPVFSFENFDKASMFFDLSYAGTALITDELNVFLSTDCGNTYSELIYSKSGLELATVPNEIVGFVPKDESEWRTEFIDLSDFAGLTDLRVVFAVNTGTGNNLYLDNVEFYQDNDPFPLKIESQYSRLYPNPTYSGRFNLTFNLPEHQDVDVVIFNSMGQRVAQYGHNSVLNQTYTYLVEDMPNEIYIVKIVGSNFTYTQKLINLR